MKDSVLFLLALLVAMPVSFLTDLEDGFTDNDLIRAYCDLVRREKFYRFHNLEENCFLYVKIFGDINEV
jgi:hypothetical protein